MGILKNIINTVVLPREVTEFEKNYLQRMNRISMIFFALHFPAFIALAYFNGTGPLLAAGLTAAVLMGPVVAYKTLPNHRHVSMVYGFTSMLMGGLLVHFGQGPVQIEMHFYFFAMLAMLALYGNPAVIVTAAITVAVHHFVLWMYLPASVFNYDAPLWVVLVHAGFVVVESVGTCFIARSFFDNVIGLEKIVRARTNELDARNRGMSLVLDNVRQGFMTVNHQGELLSECSAVVGEWFGVPEEKQSFSQFIARTSEDFSASFAQGWEQMMDGFLPLDLCLDQMPKSFQVGELEFYVDYRPIFSAQSLSEDDASEMEGMLLVISDVTEAKERERLEAEQRETFKILDRIVSDRVGFIEYFSEAEELVASIVEDHIENISTLKRALHTLKGNSMIFGVQTVADICHAMESHIVEFDSRPTDGMRQHLKSRWSRLHESLHTLIGNSYSGRIEIEEAQFQELLEAALQHENHDRIAEMIADIKLEPTESRLRRAADQARRISHRLGKGELEIDIDHEMLRLDPESWAGFWSAFVHVVRNAVDHGLEMPNERLERGKKDAATLRLKTFVKEGQFVIEIQDDGRGIDWDGVRERAKSLGIGFGNREELTKALFTEGLSTKTEVSELSGRGVGLAAVREACEAKGGSILVESEQGKGTTVAFHFPVKSMRPSVQEMSAAA